jgi:acetyl esterase
MCFGLLQHFRHDSMKFETFPYFVSEIHINDMKHLILILGLFCVSCLIQAQESKTSPALNSFDVIQNVEWAKPDGIALTMDIYTPKTGRKNYPVYVIFHGGGWLINNETIMDQMSQYIVEHSEYVVCNVNYRLLPQNQNKTTMNQIIEDVMGAVLYIKDNISRYKGNPNQIAVSGDSAGGHLSAMIVNAGDKLESDGFAGPTLGFKPTYLPPGKTAEDVAKNEGLMVQAAVLNYPATDIYKACLGKGDGTDGFETSGNFFWQMGQASPRGIFGNDKNVKDNPEYYKAVSPIYNIPQAGLKKLPPTLCAVGSKDNLTTPALVKEYADALAAAGQPVEYWVYEGRPHAYLDSGANQYLGTSFEKDGPEAIDRIIMFLNSVFKSSTKKNARR